MKGGRERENKRILSRTNEQKYAYNRQVIESNNSLFLP